jgi:hypothetical protein
MNCIACNKRIRKPARVRVLSSHPDDMEFQITCPHCSVTSYTFVNRRQFARLDHAEALHRNMRKLNKMEAA